MEKPDPETPPTAQFCIELAEPDPLMSKDAALVAFDQIAQSIAVTEPASEKSMPVDADGSSAMIHGRAAGEAIATVATVIIGLWISSKEAMRTLPGSDSSTFTVPALGSTMTL